jgi:cyclopropane fatty-acyl-phospholipid synthase-like methyltransferase
MTVGENLRTYSDAFFDRIDEGSFRSAEVIVPLVCELIRPRSVVDVGCGRGLWLRAFRQHGVASILGMDGDYVSREKLAIPAECFHPVNLAEPFALDQRFDLAISLEVAEHLPARGAAHFVHNITRTAPFILFSAAIPAQGGSHHVNEEWPWYWERLFKAERFVRLDPIQRHIRDDPRVDWWYRQNLYLYAAEERVANDSRLRAEREYAIAHPFEWVHLEVLKKTVTPLNLLQKAIRKMARMCGRGITV